MEGTKKKYHSVILNTYYSRWQRSTNRTTPCHEISCRWGSVQCWNSSTVVSKLKQNNLLLIRMVECCVEVLSYYKLTTSVTDTNVQSVQLYTTALKLHWIPKADLWKSRGHNILRQSSYFSKKSTSQPCTLHLTVLYKLEYLFIVEWVWG